VINNEFSIAAEDINKAPSEPNKNVCLFKSRHPTMATITLSRFSKAPPNGPSKLSKILDHLNQQPKLQLKNVASFKIQWEAQKSSSEVRYTVQSTFIVYQRIKAWAGVL